MRSLTPELLAAQKSPSAVPYLEAVVSERIGGVRRLAWSRLYTGSEADGYHAACMPSDGSVIRALVRGGHVYYQRVASPGAGSDFSSWTDLGAAATADVSLCSEGARVLLFYVDTGGLAVKVRESTDSGATLGPASTAITAGGTVTWLAADVKPNGDACLLYSVGVTVYAVKRAGGTWGATAAWTNSAASIAGLACYHQGDWNTAVCGADAAGGAFAWTAVFGDGFSQASGTWSALREVSRASTGTGVSFRAPFLSRPDTYRLSFVEKYTGTAPYNRPYLSHSPASADFASNLWREPVPFDVATDYGLALAFSASAAWASTPSGVWTATLDAPTLDVTADMLEAETDDRPFGGRLRLVLRNDDGRYSELPAPLHPGAEVALSPGFMTPNGPEASDGPAYWITRVERRTGGGEATLLIEARDGWSLLEAWRARRQYTWAAGTQNVFGILQFIFSRAGLEFAGSGASSASTSLYPAFTISPGESALTAVRRLLDKVPDVIFLRGPSAFLTEPLASETADYAYGTDHRIVAARYAEEAGPANRVQVFGKGVFVERFDWAGVATANDRLEQVVDTNLTTVAQAESRGDALLRDAAIGAAGGEITAPVNCGLELYDVIEVTDLLAGLTAARRRVLGLGLRYSAARGLYEQRVRLGGV
ncbi:MAG TPA: hypothetical protein VLS25_05605 [Dehalococcoidia bacterium]|nr:hypothetical protein [Dehalococcoidia bacterium]